MKHEFLSCETEVLSGETLLHRIGSRVFLRKNKGFFGHLEQHLNPIFGSCLIANFLLTKIGPLRVFTCSRSSPEVTTGSYPFDLKMRETSEGTS